MDNMITNALLLSNLTTMINAGGALAGGKLILGMNADPLPPTAVLADVELPTFTGYATSTAVTFGTPHVDDAGNVLVFVFPKEFKVTTNGDPETVTMVALVNSAGDTLLASHMLTEPITFETTDDVYQIGMPVILSQPAATEEQIHP